MGLGFVAFLLDWNNVYRGDFMLMAFFSWWRACVSMVRHKFPVSRTTSNRGTTAVWETWREPLRGDAADAASALPGRRHCCAEVFVTLYLAISMI